MIAPTSSESLSIYNAADDILLDLQKISNLSLNKCFFCNKSIEKGQFSFKNEEGVIFSCAVCIIRVALTQILNKDNLMKEIDLAQIIDLVTTSYIAIE